VKGSVTVQVENPMYYLLKQRDVEATQFIRKIAPIDGKAVVTFDIKDDLLLTDPAEYTRYLNFQATVTEELTGKLIKALHKFILSSLSLQVLH
jgi:hypothetical protein